MGGKPTKTANAGSYIPETPVPQYKTSEIDNVACNARPQLDPRSPAGCRTPIVLPTSEGDHNDKTLDVLRKRFLKTFTYDINEPRSPSLNLKRTPLVFNDTFEKPLDLDDTFSNLFVESFFPKNIKQMEQREGGSKHSYSEEECNYQVQKEKILMNFEEIEAEKGTSLALQQEFDPRSPSIGVERTPIIFTDDEIDETSEDVMLESILATLSLDMNSSGDISVKSTKSQNEKTSIKTNLQVVPLNKDLDRVRTGKKIFLKSKLHKPLPRTAARKIYEDKENCLPLTPIFKNRQSDKNCLKNKRTPLICVRNRNDTHSRSRSVESSIKSIKTRLALTSFDDNLNPTEKSNVCVTRHGSQGSLDRN